MKLLYSFLKDLRLSLKGFYIYIEVGFALIFVAVLLLVVPENFERKVTVYAHLDLDAAYREMAENALAQDGYEIITLSSREEVETELAGNRSSVGLAVSMEIPASSGVQGPGEIITRDGPRASIWSTVTLSLRNTRRSNEGSSSPNRWTRL